MLKEIVKEKFGSINNFVETVNSSISRTQIYYLLTDDRANPTIKTMEELAKVIGCDLEIVINEFKDRRLKKERSEDGD